MFQLIAYGSFIFSLFWMTLGKNAASRTGRVFLVVFTFMLSVMALASSK